MSDKLRREEARDAEGPRGRAGSRRRSRSRLAAAGVPAAGTAPAAPKPAPKPAPGQGPASSPSSTAATAACSRTASRRGPSRSSTPPGVAPATVSARGDARRIFIGLALFGVWPGGGTGEVGRPGLPLPRPVRRREGGLPALTTDAVWIAIKVLIVLHVILINGLWSIWWERKISAHIQSRVGPTYAGASRAELPRWARSDRHRRHQALLKEDITLAAADQWLHALAPAIVVIPCVIAFAPVLFGTQRPPPAWTSARSTSAFAGITVIVVVMAGWASGNKYSLLEASERPRRSSATTLRGFVVPVLMLRPARSTSRSSRTRRRGTGTGSCLAGSCSIPWSARSPS